MRERERERGRINSDILQQGEGELEKNFFFASGRSRKGDRKQEFKKRERAAAFTDWPNLKKAKVVSGKL